MKKIIYYTCITIGLVSIIYSCKKKAEELPTNPFAESNTATSTKTTEVALTPDFKSIYTKIFQPKCGNQSCHDGHFEPDFRTIESAYATMVYQPVIKHTLDGRYKMRVIPGNIDSSWLYNRVVTADAQLGRMPLYKNQLATDELNAIKTWISNGAKDQYNQPAREPNSEPQVQYYAASDTNNNVINRVDTNRVAGSASPFIVHTGKQLTLYVIFSDDHTPINQLQNVRMKLSQNIDGFSTTVTQTITGTYSPIPWFDGFIFTVNTSSLPANKTLYFRFYANDGTTTTDTEFPITNMWPWWKNYASLIVK
ncbi:MAG: hypothetical protein H7331_11715 [Bacteroidia bacterium]|nr:hypothetical protein [Bacteroidia bacterium]